MKNLITFLLFITYINTYSQIDFINHLVIDKTQSIYAIRSTLTVDLDGDGWNDIISSSYYGEQIVWQKNLDGQGEFSKIKYITSNIEKPNISIGDIDGDGDIDLFVTSSYSDVLSVFKNDGYGNFTEIIIDSSISFYSVTPYDFDNDGDLDLVTRQYEYPEVRMYWYENTTGNGDVFQKNMLSYSGNSGKMVDFDNDGDLDILSIVAVYEEYIDYVWYENIDGNYGNSILLHHHEPTTYEWLNYMKSGYYVSDIDNDNDTDIFIVTTDGISLITNQGNGNFSSANLILTNVGYGIKSIKFNDIDNDGDLDLIVASTLWQDNDRISWYENTDGNGTFNTVSNLISNSTEGVTSIDVKDIDQDSELDIVVSTAGDNKLVWFKNLGDGINFSNEKQISIKIQNQGYINVIDIDNDGDKDILMLSEGSIVMHENLDGFGNMSLQKILKSDNITSMYTGDIDNDGDIDILGRSNNDIIWYENLENSNFSDLQIILQTNSSHSAGKMILFDYDNDGDNDILKTFHVNSSSGGLEMIENLGNGNYSDVNVFYNAGTNGVQNLDLKDIDGDGDKDIFISIYNNDNHYSDKIVWFENTDGNGNFGVPTTVYSHTVTRALLVDLDNDGDLDIVSGNSNSSFSKFIGWQENDGTGNFSSKINIDYNHSYNQFYVSDIDNDGDIDILRYYDYDGLSWFENDGFTTFLPKASLMNDVGISNIITITDINNDTSLDIITYNYDDKSISWFENRGLVKNRIQGIVKFDLDSNGCDGADASLENIKIETTNGSSTYSTFTNSNGYYQTYPIEEGSFTTVVSTIPSYFSATPNSYSSNFVGVGNIEVNDFCITSNQNVNDLNVTILPLSDVRPGFLSKYRIKVNNVGSTQLSGNVVFDFDGSIQNFVSASQSVSSQTSDSISFDFQNLNPFDSLSIDVKLQAFAPPTLQINEILNYTATVNPISNDFTPSDNIFTFDQTVIGSYDPNDITVLEGHHVLYEDADEFLHYIIRFQNTGTADAINILVENSLDENLDGSTFEIIDVSHNCITEIVNNTKVSFTFENIHLPDSTSNEEDSNGFIAYRIKPKQGVNLDDVVFNTAEIYFDYNPAIITNTTWTDFNALLLVVNNESFEFTVYPIPVNDTLKIQSNSKIKEIQIFNSLSQKILEVKYSNSIDVSTLIKGVYYVRLEDVNGNLSVKRIIKN